MSITRRSKFVLYNVAKMKMKYICSWE